MKTLSEVPSYQMLDPDFKLASGHPLSYYVAKHIRPGVFIYQPTPTIVAGFVDESDAEKFIKAAADGCNSYSIHCTRSHFEFHAPLLKGFREKWKDRLI